VTGLLRANEGSVDQDSLIAELQERTRSIVNASITTEPKLAGRLHVSMMIEDGSGAVSGVKSILKVSESR
jgi:hypothetical protein